MIATRMIYKAIQGIQPQYMSEKERLEAKAARTLEALEAELKPPLDAITTKDARGWFKHAGYVLH